MNFLVTAITVLWLILAPGFRVWSQEGEQQTARYLQRVIEKTVEVHYLLYLPPQYDEGDAKWPLLLFLHGAGERGEDLELVKVHGPPKMIAEGEDFPFVVVSPQCPNDVWWDMDVLKALLDTIMEQHRIDADRVYVTGLSMGGYGTWRLAHTYPDRFAAVVPICGGGEADKAHLMKDIPTWAFHGAKDEAVPLERSQEMVEALRSAGGEVQFTVYPDAGHVEAWEIAYSDPELWKWLAKQRRKK